MTNAMQEAQAYAEDNGLLFMETSAKTAMNVNEIFLAIGWSFFAHPLHRRALARPPNHRPQTAKKLPKNEPRAAGARGDVSLSKKQEDGGSSGGGCC